LAQSALSAGNGRARVETSRLFFESDCLDPETGRPGIETGCLLIDIFFPRNFYLRLFCSKSCEEKGLKHLSSVVGYPFSFFLYFNLGGFTRRKFKLKADQQDFGGKISKITSCERSRDFEIDAKPETIKSTKKVL
jgi:hypothetical protein